MSIEINSKLTNDLVNNFFRYVAISSQSDATQSKLPTTAGQLQLIQLLHQELEQLGVQELNIDQYGNLTGLFKGTKQDVPSIGFCAHVDTVDIGLAPDVKPQILKFTGEDLIINRTQNIVLKAQDFPELQQYLGEKIIFSDGTSVLGADDKAAIATIMTCLQYIKNNKLETGDIYIAFVPDEEVGLKGAKVLDLNRYKPDNSYTIDGTEVGGIMYENFNAAQSIIKIDGITAHPVSAKGVLVNPILLAQELINQFDPLQTPEHTEGKEGYWWFNYINGNQSSAELHISIRDFDKLMFAQRLKFIEQVVQQLSAKNPRARYSYSITLQYTNIADSFTGELPALTNLYKAFEKIKLKPQITPMRGGTDGSALSLRGLPTPNYFTGGMNPHSRFEYLPIKSFAKSMEVTLNLILITGQSK